MLKLILISFQPLIIIVNETFVHTYFTKFNNENTLVGTRYLDAWSTDSQYEYKKELFE